MRVMFPIVGNSLGGSHISLLELAKGLDQQGVEVRIIAHYEGAGTEYFRRNGLVTNVENIPIVSAGSSGVRRLIEQIRGVPRLRKILQDIQPDIVHGNDYRVNLSWLPACKVAGIPYVWHQRTLWLNSVRQNGMARLAHVIIAASTIIEQRAHQSLRNKVMRIPNPVEPERDIGTSAARYELRRYFDLNEKAYVVGAFGNVSALKRIDVFYATFREVATRLPDSEGLFVWFGENRTQDNSQSTPSVQNMWKLLRHNFVDKPQQWMAGCDVVFAPAVGEGFGRTIIEAMHAGTPVVAADAGGHSEIIEDGYNGWLFKADDIHDAADAVCYALRSHDRRSIVDNAINETLPQYRANSHVEKILNVYRSLVKDGSMMRL